MSHCDFCRAAEGPGHRLVRGQKASICEACVQLAEETLEPPLEGAPFIPSGGEGPPFIPSGVEGARPPFIPSGVEGAPFIPSGVEGARAKPVAVIPARFASTRFPGKPLALLAGKPMLQHVVERCLESRAFAQVLIATDDAGIALAARGFGAQVVMTSESCPSGTDRVAEVAAQVPASVYVNVQGDEPLVSPAALGELARAFDDPSVQMATLVRVLDEEERPNPNVVKAVLDRRGRALYFSRADVPFTRDAGASSAPRYAHVGLYGYRRETLLRLAGLPPTPLELTEKLEQLRALEHGIEIRCLVTQYRSLGVDTPEDLVRAEAALHLP